MSEAKLPEREPDEGVDGPRRLSVQQIRMAARIATQGLRLDKSCAEIIARLRQAGLTQREAEGIEDHARLAYQYSQMRIGTMLMVSGAIWLAGAILALVLYPGPGTTRYAWILLIAAALQWIYGWQRRRYARRLRPMRDRRQDR